jgi:acetolactate synthase-1/2/3 large subunit
MRFDDRVTGKLSAYAPQARVIHIDIDPAEISKNVKAVQGIHSDVRSFLEKLLASRELKFQPRHDWWLKIAAFRKELTPLQEAELKKGSGSEGKLLMKTCVRALSDISKGNIMVVTDVGLHQMITARFFNYCKTNSFYTSGGAGTMGAGLPMAIGVQLVNPQEQVWCICGDGGFQMNIQELGTIMQYQLPIKIMLLNNSNLGMVRQWQTLFFNRRYAATPMQNPDYSWIAKAYGIAYDRITKVTEVAPALKKASKIPGAQLLEFVCDPGEIILPMVPNGKSFAEMILEVAA